MDFAIVLRLRDIEHLGWFRGAEEYRKRTGQWISRDTFKRRYLEATYTPGIGFMDVLKNWHERLENDG